ncbi:MAG: tetratricopeptide repeat protein [Rhodospirillaceae bacterium]|nr:tetratricopeptide repeat protein [Rhodospirillaceae bacterium]
MAQIQQDHPSQIPLMLNEAYNRFVRGEIAPAEMLYRRVLAMQPRNFDALHMLAVVGYSTNNIEPALALFEKARAIKPRDFGLMVNYGAALKKNKQYQEALECYDIALAQKPDLFEAVHNKASCLFELEDVDGALALYQRCLDLKPNDSEILRGIGNCYRVKDRWQEAIEWYERGTVANPKDAANYVSIAQVCRDRGWLATSLAMCDKALQLDPRSEAALTIGSLVSLKRGEFETGWKHYEGRFRYADDQVSKRPLPPVYWAGEDLKDKTILIWSEQGVGDEILYASMLPDLVSRGPRVIFECDPRMVPVYARSFPQISVKSWKTRHQTATPASELNYQSSVVSLGRFFRTNFAQFPKHGGYLKCDPQKRDVLKQRYGTGPLIGISWRSSAKGAMGVVKTSTLADWEPVLRTPGVRFVSLQYGDCRAEIAEAKAKFGVEIIEDPEIDSMKDMDSFFDQVGAMDLVISTSNTTVHVAGAMGVPLWLLLAERTTPLWYWFTNRTDSPWYPSIRIIGEPPGADASRHWIHALVGQAAADLPGWLAKRSRA